MVLLILYSVYTLVLGQLPYGVIESMNGSIPGSGRSCVKMGTWVISTWEWEFTRDTSYTNDKCEKFSFNLSMTDEVL